MAAKKTTSKSKKKFDPSNPWTQPFSSPSRTKGRHDDYEIPVGAPGAGGGFSCDAHYYHAFAHRFE